MGTVIPFAGRRPARVNPRAQRAIARMFQAEEREAQRRSRLYGAGEVSRKRLRILALYPWLRLTHAKRARVCGECGARIAPGELHFVFHGEFVCQSGTCLDTPRRPSR